MCILSNILLKSDIMILEKLTSFLAKYLLTMQVQVIARITLEVNKPGLQGILELTRNCRKGVYFANVAPVLHNT